MTHGRKEQRVREIAYLLWEKAGSPHGESERHWAEAEALYAIEIAERDSAAERKAIEGEPPGDSPKAPEPAKDKLSKPQPEPTKAAEPTKGAKTAKAKPEAKAKSKAEPKPKAEFKINGAAKKVEPGPAVTSSAKGKPAAKAAD